MILAKDIFQREFSARFLGLKFSKILSLANKYKILSYFKGFLLEKKIKILKRF